jgi:hypothetical protein
MNAKALGLTLTVIALIALVLVIACERRDASRRWRANYDAMITDETNDGPTPCTGIHGLDSEGHPL